MSSAPLDIAEPSESTPRKRKHGRFYTFVVIGLATFLLGLAVWRPPLLGVTARSTVALQDARPSSDPANTASDGQVTGPPGAREFAHYVTSDVCLQRAAEKAGLLATSSADSVTSVVSQLYSNTRVTSSKGSQDGLRNISIEFDGENDDTAIQFVSALAHALVGEVGASAQRDRLAFDERRQLAESQLARAQQEFDDAKATLNQYVDDQLRRLQKAQQADLGSVSTDEPRADGDEPAAEGAREGKRERQNQSTGNVEVSRTTDDGQSPRNPRWLELQHELADLQTRRDRLMESRTSAHPVVVDAQETIDGLRKLLAAIPEFLQDYKPPDVPQDDSTASGHVPPSDKRSEQPTIKSREELLADIRASAEYHEMYRPFESAKGRLHDAKQVADEAANLPIPSGPLARIAQTAHIAQRRGGSPSRARTATLGLVAMLVGWWFASRLARKVVAPALSSVTDVVESLNLEVAGAICTTDGPEIHRSRPSDSHLTRAATLLSELTLVSIVLWLAYLAIVQRRFAGDFLENPFAAYSYAIGIVRDWLI